MKFVMIAAVLLAGVVRADEAADRASIEKTVSQMSASPAPAGLFTEDFDGRTELARFGIPTSTGQCPENCPAGIPIVVANQPGVVVISKEPMGEAVWLPKKPIVISKIRILTADVAMVDAVWTGPVLILLKKTGTDWKIASLRILAQKTN
jgi:hypothetical protein